MKKMDLFKQFVDRKFDVIVNGEKEQSCNFIKVLKLLCIYGEFFEYSGADQSKEMAKWIKQGYIYVDNNITITIKQ